jgi:hypothetical protein
MPVSHKAVKCPRTPLVSAYRVDDLLPFPGLRSPPHINVQREDVGQALEEFLRFAEELQDKIAPGWLWLSLPCLRLDAKLFQLLTQALNNDLP